MPESEIVTEFLYEVKIPQKPPHLIGEGPHGNRRITYPGPGATVRGPKMNGTVLEGGGDPFLVRRDGVGEVDARVTIQTDGGDLFMMVYKGLLVDRDDRDYFYVGVLFETGSERLAWLNATVGVARGFIPEDLPRPCIGYRVYAIV